jgi:hypothetical protein
MADMNPDEAAQYATGDGDRDDAAIHEGTIGGDGFEGGGLSSSGPMERLFDGGAPGPAVDELRRDYDLPRSLAICGRGIVRVGTGDGVPPVAEIIGGSIMAMLEHRDGSDESTAGELAEVEPERGGEL